MCPSVSSLVQVLSSRKGLRNQLKGLLWRGKSGSGASLAAEPVRVPSASGASYGAASVEGQMRALADVAFVMQDYELAASTLRLLSSDLKADKAWKHYAGAQVSQQAAATSWLWLCHAGSVEPHTPRGCWHAK